MYTPGYTSGSAYAPSFWERLGTGWEFLKESMVMWTKDKDLILPSVLSLLTMGLGLAGLAGFLHLTGDLPKLISGESDVEFSAGAYAGFLIYGILAYIISYFYGGMTVHLVDVHLRGRDARLGEAFTDAILNLPAILILALISIAVDLAEAIVQSAARSARRHGGFGGVLVGGTMGMAARGANWIWKVVVCLMLPIVILEDASISAAIRRGQEMHRRDLLGIGIGEVGVDLIGRGMFFLVVILGGLAIVLSLQYARALLWVAIIFTALLVGAAWSLGAFLRWAYYTMLYSYAVEREQNAAQATMPLPLANVTGYAPAFAPIVPGGPYQSPPRPLDL